MTVISIVIPRSLDSLGRVIAVMRRAKVDVVQVRVLAEGRTYRVCIELNGTHDNVSWLVAKLDKLPEVLKIDAGDREV
ncbi:MAG: ACT domain-containing protein [Thermoproteaceae archaeon]|jgi:acetolactate synthase II small subunit|nr:ACT domain-containing protein [Thermoproteaceae archaeon]